MTEYTAKRSSTRCPSHPGALLREDVIPATGKSKTEIAGMLGISRQHLHYILAEAKPLSPDIAVRVAALFGGSAGIWVRMQAAYDTWHAERDVDVSAMQRIVTKSLHEAVEAISGARLTKAAAKKVPTRQKVAKTKVSKSGRRSITMA
jgi:addiction module HigA family antidote